MPAVVVERPKIGRPMWDALKNHIVKERQRKKQEQEADAEVERQRREREDQQKEQEMTLEETKEQITHLETRLAQLKEDKHQLFLQLKRVLNEDDTKRRIKESSLNSEMMFLHAYPPNNPMPVHPGHGPPLYLHNIGAARPMYKVIKEEPLGNTGSTLPATVYAQPLALIPTQSHQGQAPQKRSRSPSPPPPSQLYHPYKAGAPSPYNPKSISNPYGANPAVPGSIFYTHPISVSAPQSAPVGAAYPPPVSMYNYPPGPSSSSSRPPYSTQGPPSSKDDGLPPSKHHPSIYLGHGASNQMTSRGYGHQPMEHLIGKNSNVYGGGESDKFYVASHPPGSSSSLNSSSGSLRPSTHGPLSASLPVPGNSHPSGIPIQPSQVKSGSITSGHPLRAPPSSAPYHTTVSVSHGQAPRLVYTQSGGQPPQGSRYYSNQN